MAFWKRTLWHMALTIRARSPAQPTLRETRTAWSGTGRTLRTWALAHTRRGSTTPARWRAATDRPFSTATVFWGDWACCLAAAGARRTALTPKVKCWDTALRQQGSEHSRTSRAHLYGRSL